MCADSTPEIYKHLSPTHAGPTETLMSLFLIREKHVLQMRRAEIGVSCHRPASAFKPPATTKAGGKEKFRSSGGMTGPFPTYNLGHLGNQISHFPKSRGGVRVHAQPSSRTIPAPVFSFHTLKATCGPGGNMCPGQGLGQGDTDQTSSSPAWTQGSFPSAHTNPLQTREKKTEWS